MIYDRILVRYGELSLKGQNKKMFIRRTNEIISHRLRGYNVKLERNHDRLYVILNGENHEKIISILDTVFGLYSYSLVIKVEKDMEKIKNMSLQIMKELDINKITFKVNTKRADKQYPIRSMDITKEVSAHVLVNTENITVDVHNPDVYLNIEVRTDGGYIYTNKILGIGGFPVGIAGKGLLMLSGGIDSPVAGYLTMKRGVEIEAIHFESPPHTSIESKQKVIDLAEKLSVYAPFNKIKIHMVPFTKLQEELYKNVEEKYMMTVMRRMMYRIAEKVAKNIGALILTNGESIGQVASQTLQSIRAIERVVDIPVIRPVATMDKVEIIDISRKIDTFDISIKPFEDCCTIFVPKHPVTKPTIDRCEYNESTFEWESLIEEAVNNTELLIVNNKEKLNLINKEVEDLF